MNAGAGIIGPRARSRPHDDELPPVRGHGREACKNAPQQHGQPEPQPDLIIHFLRRRLFPNATPHHPPLSLQKLLFPVAVAVVVVVSEEEKGEEDDRDARLQPQVRDDPPENSPLGNEEIFCCPTLLARPALGAGDDDDVPAGGREIEQLLALRVAALAGVERRHSPMASDREGEGGGERAVAGAPLLLLLLVVRDRARAGRRRRRRERRF